MYTMYALYVYRHAYYRLNSIFVIFYSQNLESPESRTTVANQHEHTLVGLCIIASIEVP